MELEVGTVLEGKITGITKFGAFVSLPEGRSGLVHISEIANTYVTDVRDHVEEGGAVKVKVISIGNDGKINLSIKKAAEAPRQRPGRQPVTAVSRAGESFAAAEPSFEDKLKRFMQDSDSKISGNRLYSDKRNGTRRRKD